MILNFLSFLLVPTVLPTYKAELLARAGAVSSYNLPSYAVISDASPNINNNGDVAFRVISTGVIDDKNDSDRSAIWLKKTTSIDGQIVLVGPEKKIISEIEISDSGDILFTQYDEKNNDGLFLYSARTLKAKNIYANKNATAINYPRFTSNNAIVFRVTELDNSRKYVNLTSKGFLSNVVEEGVEYSYLFGPGVNSKAQMIYKVRFGAKGSISESNADQIIFLAPNSRKSADSIFFKTIIASDYDSDENSDYLSFDNSPEISNNGYIVFTATLKDKKRAIIAIKDNVKYVVAKEGRDDVSQIELFAAKINDNGLVVFRAKSSAGQRGIYIINPFSSKPELQRLLAEGDAIVTDQGVGAILNREGYPGFDGNIDLNNKNEIVLSLIVASENQKNILGTAVYKLHPL